MAEKLGDAYVDIGTREQMLDQGLSRSLGKVRKFAIAASGIFAGVRASRGVFGLVDAYSDSVETINKFREVFRGGTKDIEAAAKELSGSYGLVGVSAKKLLADTGDILVGFGFTEDEALDLAMRTNKLAVDLASFTNIEGGAAKASEALTKALVGESEQAKSLGIVIRQDSKEYKDIVERMRTVHGMSLLQAKAFAALEISTNQTQKAQGDYARTQGQLANQIRLSGERFRELKEESGRIITEFLSANNAATKLNSSLAALSGTLRGIDPVAIKTTSQVVAMSSAIIGLYLANKKLIPAITIASARLSALFGAGVLASSAGFVAAAAGIGLIVRELIRMQHASNQLKESELALTEQETRLTQQYGTANIGVIRGIREAIQSGNEEQLEYLRTRFPKAVEIAQSKLEKVFKDTKLTTRVETLLDVITEKNKEDVLQILRAIETNDAETLNVLGKVIPETFALVSSKLGGIDITESPQKRNFQFTAFADAIRQIQVGVGTEKQDREMKVQTGLLGDIKTGIREMIETIGRRPVIGV